jgi:hypothetical protein
MHIQPREMALCSAGVGCVKLCNMHKAAGGRIQCACLCWACSLEAKALWGLREVCGAIRATQLPRSCIIEQRGLLTIGEAPCNGAAVVIEQASNCNLWQRCL